MIQFKLDIKWILMLITSLSLVSCWHVSDPSPPIPDSTEKINLEDFSLISEYDQGGLTGIMT